MKKEIIIREIKFFLFVMILAVIGVAGVLGFEKILSIIIEP